MSEPLPSNDASIGQPEACRNSSPTFARKADDLDRVPTSRSPVGTFVVDALGIETARERSRPTTPRSSSDPHLRSVLAPPLTAAESPHVSSSAPQTPSNAANTLTLLAGLNARPFTFPTKLLASHCPYFARMFAEPSEQPTLSSLTFPDLDENAFALFSRWLHGEPLHGPKDFHSMHHYIVLYLLGQRVGAAPLQNLVMDRVRAYYHDETMTAPAYRLEFVYASTQGPCAMRRFLVHTAAYRVLVEHGGGQLSDAMAMAVRKGGDLAVDFANALAELHRNGLVDVRKGDPCHFHVHEHDGRCPAMVLEPYEDE